MKGIKSLKRLMLRIVLLLITVVLLSYISRTPLASTVVGSKHDFSTSGGGTFYSTNEDEVCVFCHTPHNARTDMSYLWNRNNTVTTFELYSSTTLNATLNQPQGASLMCLSCHDGLTAINVLRNYSPTQPIMSGNLDQIGDVYYPGSLWGWPGVNIGEQYPGGGGGLGNLTNDHPVSFIFDASLIALDPGLQLPPSGDPVKLYDNRVECASCHNPHDNANGQFLVKSNNNSALCLTCHKK